MQGSTAECKYEDEMPPKTVRKKPLFKKHKQDGTRGEVCSGITVTTTEGKYGTAIRRRRKRSLPSHDPSSGHVSPGRVSCQIPSSHSPQSRHPQLVLPPSCEGCLEFDPTGSDTAASAAKQPKLTESSSNTSTGVPPLEERHLSSAVLEAADTNPSSVPSEIHPLTAVQPSATTTVGPTCSHEEGVRGAALLSETDGHTKQASHTPIAVSSTSPTIGLSAEHTARQAVSPHLHGGVGGMMEDRFSNPDACMAVEGCEGMEMDGVEMTRVGDCPEASASTIVELGPQYGMEQKSAPDPHASNFSSLDCPVHNIPKGYSTALLESVTSALPTITDGKHTGGTNPNSDGESRQLDIHIEEKLATDAAVPSGWRYSREYKEDSLIDELFGISEDSATHVEDELLDGICPEDLNFTLNASVFDSSRSPPATGTSQQMVSQTPKLPSSPSTVLHSTPFQAAVSSASRTDLHRAFCCVPEPALQRPSHKITANRKESSTQNSGSPLRVDPQALYASAHLEGRAAGGVLLAPENPDPAADRLHCYPPNTFYGLPMRVLSCLEEHRGIKQLYAWQDTCLRLPGVVRGGNLIYSLPTSGGKTLVAEIIILRQLLLGQKDALLILPFVSIVQEKVRQLVPFASDLGFAVEEYAASRGGLPPRKRRKKTVVYIATIEKANALVNSLIELRRLGSLGLVVVDELHMVGDGGVRGATLEACLAKIQHCSVHTQLVGMSATLSNLRQLAQFLRAEVYSSDFRPVELREYVKVGRCVYSVEVEGGVVDFLPERDIQDISADASAADTDQLVPLVMEVLPHSSCLLFCPTRRNCQNVALLLTSCLPSSLREIKAASRRRLLKLLSIEASGVCPVLARTVPYGIAYHHSGLTADERRVIEEAYLEGVLCLLTCTSTLAAGVNLPAKRVILRSPYVGNQFLSRSQYKQMVGRAGRVGLCDAGESVLIVRQQDRERVLGLLSAPYDSCHSGLLGGGAGALLSLLLTLIGLKLVKSTPDLSSFLRSTLLYVQHDHNQLNQSCSHALSRLVTMGYIIMETDDTSNDSTFKITSLGKATYKGCLPVESAHVVYGELMAAQQCLVLSTELHLLFLATPPDLAPTIQPNWMVFFETLTSLGPDELRVAEVVGVNPGLISRKATGTAGKMSEETQALYHRFYLSLILHSLLRSGTSQGVWSVADRFQCSRGFLQNIINSTAAFASCLVHFTEELPELWSLHLLLPAVAKRLAFTASAELLPLMEVPGIKQGRARQLLAAGFHTPQDIASADPKLLCEKIEHMYPKQARKLTQAAKALLADQAEALLEEAEELMALVPPTANS